MNDTTESYVLKGFILIGVMANNETGKLSNIGELSSSSASYATEKGFYSNTAYADVELVSFISKYKIAGQKKVSNNVSSVALSISSFLYNLSKDGDLSEDKNSIAQAILSEYSAENVSSVVVGDLVTEGAISLPEFISYIHTFAPDGTEDTVEGTVKLWLSDPAFNSQYDEYEMKVIPAVMPVDLFHSTYANVKPLVDAFTMPKLTLAVQAAANGFPYTVIHTEIFEWVDAFDDSITIDVPWTVIIYGNAGNNIDRIKAVLSSWILSNTTKTREDWIKYFPSIFKSTEFIITPLWDQYSIPNKTLQAGLYSPVNRLSDVLEIGYDTAVNYPTDHVDRFLTSSAFMYKSLGFLAVGGPENLDGIMNLSEKFKDYIVVSTNSPDFNRMSPRTQQWVMLMTELLKVAEEMTEYSTIPIGMTRLIRNGVLYVVASYENVQYIVVAKKYFLLAQDNEDVE